MTEHKHTPGPWRLKVVGTGTARGFVIIAEENYFDDGSPHELAEVEVHELNDSFPGEVWFPKENAEEIAANARLMAAAPDLLAMLEEADRRLDELQFFVIRGFQPHDTPEMSALRDRIQAAIAKAYGTHAEDGYAAG